MFHSPYRDQMANIPNPDFKKILDKNFIPLAEKHLKAFSLKQ